MANYVAARSVRNMLKNNSVRSTTVMNNHAIPSSHPLPLPCDSENDVRGTSDSIMLRSLRIAVTPSHAQGSIEVPIQSSACSSTLAGDPKRLRHCQDIRAEILEKWNTKPKPDPTQREWIKSIMYNTVAAP